MKPQFGKLEKVPLRAAWENKGSRIALYKEGLDPTDEQDWANQHEWLAEKLSKFDEVFRPLVKGV